MSISKAVSANTIKPIETLWKGYRFRSRLEARWAVFFETLGIRWQYETQGFQLGDGSAYLPDFYLPDQKTYVEIKPAINYKPRKVYMAGKIENPTIDWRRTIDPFYPSNYLPGYHNYVGPYPIQGGGHTVSQVPSTHGLNSNGKYGEYDKNDIDENNYYHNVYEATADFNKELVVRRCLEGIDQCDILFAWINTLDCYGTIAEIGYASAKGKVIFIGISRDLEIPNSVFLEPSRKHNGCLESSHDLWFVESLADSSFYSDSPRHAFDYFLVRLPEPFKKIQQIDNGLLIAGNPYPGEYTAYKNWKYGMLSFFGGYFLIDSMIPENAPVHSALLKARAARFEHGEAP